MFSWSYSALKNYEQCPRRHYHYSVAKDVKEVEGKEAQAGHRLHSAFERRIKGTANLPAAYKSFEPLVAAIVAAPGETHAEQRLALTNRFQPSAYFARDVWFRTVIDASKIAPASATIFDWKSGKVNTDPLQLQLMSAALLHYRPEVRTVRAALVFLNHNRVERAEFTRDALPDIWNGVLPRVKKLEQAHQDNEFPPNPSGLCKRYCQVASCAYCGIGGGSR